MSDGNVGRTSSLRSDYKMTDYKSYSCEELTDIENLWLPKWGVKLGVWD